MKWHGRKHRIVVLAEALSVIAQEAFTARRVDKERGGSLVGIQTADESIILYAIPTGPHAETSWGHIQTDAAFQNQYLAAIASHYNRYSVLLVYQCDYHVHQMGLDHPSGTDDRTFLEILSDPDHSYLHGLPVILATFRDGRLEYVPLWITRAGNSIRTEKAELDIVKPDDPRIKTLLKGHPYVSLKEIMRQRQATSVPPHVAPSDHFLVPLAGDILMTRLVLEIEDIKTAFSVQAQLRRTLTGYPCLLAQVGEFRLFAVIPSEFPLNPATIFFRKPGESCMLEYNPRRTWNSISRIADIFGEVLEANGGTPAVNIQA